MHDPDATQPPEGRADDATAPTLDPAGPAGDSPTALPSRIGRYLVTGILGRGGMGEVYAALDDRLQRPIAVKCIHGAHRGSADARARFWREARVLAALGHPGVVTVYELGETPDGDLFMAMELVGGTPVSELLGHPWPISPAVGLARAVADTLAAAHAAGVVHRDIKPSNLMVEPDGTVRVLDFGLARRSNDAADELTRSGLVLGTPAWMAPEQVRAEAVGPPADVFAVGILLYRLLTGVHPFLRDSSLATAVAVSEAKHEPLEALRPDVPEPLRALVGRCLAREPGDRPLDGRALVGALDAAVTVPGDALARHLAGPVPADTASRAVLPPASPQPRRPGRALAIAAIAALAVAALIVAWPDERPPPGSELTTPTPAPAPAPAPRDTPTEAPAGVWAARPPRPVLGVLGLAPADDTPAGRTAADVAADALREALDDAPAQAVVIPWSTLLALGRGGALPPLETPPTSLLRPGRAPGSMDAVVTGELTRASAGVAATARLVDTATGADVARVEATGRDAAEAGWRLGLALRRTVGITTPAPEPPTRSADAWAAFVEGREAAHAGDDVRATERIEWALSLDPGFPLAAVARLEMLRSARRYDELIAAAGTLLDGARPVPDRHRVMAEALRDLAAGRPRDAVRRLHDLLRERLYDGTAQLTLLVLRSNDPDTADLREVERIARGVLTIGPGSEVAASRLVRALSARGRPDDAARALEELGVLRGSQGFLIDPWVELDLFAGRHAAAIAGFDAVAARAGGSTYAEHMGIAARILAGRCEEAAARALDRIDAAETRGEGQNLDWTWSLAIQALFCLERWAPALEAVERWAAGSASGAAQGRVLALRARAARGDAGVARDALAALDPPGADANALRSLVARVGAPAEAVGAQADAAAACAVDIARPRLEQLECARAERMLRARAALDAGDGARAVSLLDEAVGTWDDVRSEGELAGRVEAMAWRAAALEALGRSAEAAEGWRAIVALGYPRLWATDLWALARAKGAH